MSEQDAAIVFSSALAGAGAYVALAPEIQPHLIGPAAARLAVALVAIVTWRITDSPLPLVVGALTIAGGEVLRRRAGLRKAP